jgi:hypothetical protein
MTTVREALVEAGRRACGFLNCKLFVQIVTNISDLDILPSRGYSSMDELEAGDILKWYGGRHYAIYLGLAI